MQDWVVQSHVELRRNPLFRDNDNTTIERVFYYAIENAETVFKRYRADEIDFTQSVPSKQIPWIRRAMPDEYVQAPYLGTYYYLVNTDRAPVDDVRVRQALSMAVDRDKLVRSVLQHTAVPAYSITPPDTLGYFPPKIFDYDPE